ncbi:serine/threonine-protein kinase [Paludisphaera rhizosphaerae]|uniref:serine/threonine-protein kinase n=1 Tax=Paludisphaera rhizosphaerae TaxID=2711216 RepID=UPI0013EB7406|nr:serine/threonine-protein kinase [Paludisphaera rhizosphaerae]
MVNFDARDRLGGVDSATTATDAPRSVDARVVAAIEEYAALADGGAAPSRPEFLARHPSIAGPLGACLAGMDLVDAAARGLDPAVPPVAELGGYRLIREIGRGGMGVVYEAEQRELGRRVALKVLPASATTDPRQIQRFRIEAQAAALLQHPHIVPVFDVGADRGTRFYAMQLIEGRPLTRLIGELAEARRERPASSSSSARSRAREAARLGLQAAEALAHAHVMGVVHRDVKPGNLLIDGRGELWVADFGLARLHHEDAADLTQTGDLLGTLRYMSPEQVRAARGGVGPAADVYGLGATLYELLALRPAFDADDRQELVRRILNEDPPSPRRFDPALPRDLETIVLKAMEKEPAARYASAAAMADDLRRFLDDRPILARRPGLGDRLVKWSRRRRPFLIGGAAALIFALAAATAVLWASNRRTAAALLEEQLAIEYALGEFDLITRAAVENGGDGLAWTLQRAVAFYDRIPRMSDESHEVVPKALRQAAFCRDALGSPRARDDYRRAIALYERLAAERPEQVWLRTALISTLAEFARSPKAPADASEAVAAGRRALTLALAAADDPRTAAPCYATALAEAFDDVARPLALRSETAPDDLRAAARLASWAVEHVPGRAGSREILEQARSRLGDGGAG